MSNAKILKSKKVSNFFQNIDPWEKLSMIRYTVYVIKNYGRKLQVFVISQSVCLWQEFPALFNVVEPSLEWST